MTILTPCRDAETAEIPTGAARLARAAAEHGWRHRTTYACAEVGDKVIESVAVRLRRDPVAGYGLWVGGRFSFAYITSTVTSPRKVGARDLAAFVKAVPA